MKAIIARFVEQKNTQTLGEFLLFDHTGRRFECKVLELANKGNATSISRINAGVYTCRLRWSKKYSWHFEVTDVECRLYILIHFGNYHRDTRGCILLGNGFYDINNDGLKDVTSSKKTMSRLLAIAPKEFQLTILDLDKAA